MPSDRYNSCSGFEKAIPPASENADVQRVGIGDAAAEGRLS